LIRAFLASPLSGFNRALPAFRFLLYPQSRLIFFLPWFLHVTYSFAPRRLTTPHKGVGQGADAFLFFPSQDTFSLGMVANLGLWMAYGVLHWFEIIFRDF